MTSKRKNILGCLTATALATGLMVAAPAQAGEIAASAAVSNMYLWRGIDLGDGSPAVSGDLVYKFGPGFKTGIWVSSGDSALGQEYDYFAGWAGEFGGLGVDLSVWNYNYSDLGVRDDTTGELTEAVLILSYAGASFGYYNNVAGEGFAAGGNDYEYFTLGYTYEKFSGLVGFHQNDTKETDMTHLDLSYAYNDRLGFTVSKVLDQGNADVFDDDVLFALKYTLPLE